MAASWANEASSSSSFSFIPPSWKYDAFLSFSGKDTRYNFTSHLFSALQRHGFHAFIDDKKLEKGEEITSELLKAIEDSRISVVVFSKKYAESKWCLNELVKIMDCKKMLQQIVLPIFYDVDPSEVRAQKGSLEIPFAEHEKCFKEGSDDNQVKKWRKALTEAANLSGWDLRNEANRDEVKVIMEIVDKVAYELDRGPLHIAKHPVGLECRVQKLKKMLSMESNDVRIVAVWGIGGIGKTTVAKKLYNIIHRKFEGSSFLADVRENSKQPNGLVELQKKLLSNIVRNETNCIENRHQGINVIKWRAFSRKVLLVLDDVDDFRQLEALAIDPDFFGSGSRIIITTRDKSSLNVLKMYKDYSLEELDKDESLQLFRCYAFKDDHPNNDYVELSNEVVYYARGIPLALEVLGSSLCSISISEWKNRIEGFRKIPHHDIQGILKISYDTLTLDQKRLFLDIACFFVGMEQDFVNNILDSCKIYSAAWVQVLTDRCLIKYKHNKYVMHDMIRDMGREIVRQECIEEPGRRSRLWDHEDALQVLREGTGTDLVEGLILNFHEPKDVQANAKTFENMKNLRLLNLNYVRLSAGCEHLSRRLVWLSWNGFPQKILPINWSMENLVSLNLHGSSLRRVWRGTKILDKLKFLYLSHCHELTSTPDFSGLRNLEKLLLNDCIRLVEVHESIGCLSKLVVLNFKNCKKLKKLPSGIWMLKSLKSLDLSGCSILRQLAELRGSPSKSWYTFFLSWILPMKRVDSIGLSLVPVQSLSCLTTLNMEGCNLSHLPNEMGRLMSLSILDLRNNNLHTLPHSIGNLARLENLYASKCKLSHLPTEIGGLISLKHLDLRENNLDTLPDSIGKLVCLESLDLTWCKLSDLPNEIGGLTSLRALSLIGSKLRTIPNSIGNLSCLEQLYMSCCKLSHLPNEIGGLISLKHLWLSGLLRSLPDGIGNLACLEDLYLDNCKLSHLPNEIGGLISLKFLTLKGNNLRTLPESIGNLACLEILHMKDCQVSHLPNEIGRLTSLKSLKLNGNNLCTLPESIGNLASLGELYVNDCELSHLPNEIGKLTKLKTLDVGGNNLHTLPNTIGILAGLESLYCTVSHPPSEIWRLTSLTHFYITGSSFRSLPDSISSLAHLKRLKLTNCERLQLLLGLPVSLNYICAENCPSLEEISFGSNNRLEEISFGSNNRLGLIPNPPPMMDFYGCHKLLESKFANDFRKILGLLQRKGPSELGEQIDILLPGLEVPNWLQFQSTERYLSCVVPPPPRVNQKILGFIFCAVYIGGEEKLGSVRDCSFYIRNKTKGDPERYCYFPHSSNGIDKDGMWLSSVPLCSLLRPLKRNDEVETPRTLVMPLEGGDEVEISVIMDERIDWKPLKAWGIYFIYEDEDEEGNININSPRRSSSSCSCWEFLSFKFFK